MVIAFLSGSLTPEQVASVEGHAGACATCLDLLATVMRVEAKPADAALSPHASSVGRYLILGLIGRGGMGEVYAAYDPELDRRVALKLLNQDGPAPGGSVNDVVVATERRARLLREAKAIARLSHPNVVVVHDAGTWNDRVFIAMELVEGETLDAWLRVRPRTRSEILEVFVGAGRGLAAAHAAGLVHRDFKPQNVIVGRDGKARVTDFGLARRLEAEGGEGERDPAAVALPTLLGSPVGSLTQLTRTGMLIGTPSYMAPEQFRAAAADPRSDQFSFCVALYEALYGQRPFTGATLGALRDAVSRGQMAAPPDRSTVPSWLRRTVLRGLEVERDARYPSMSDLLDALDRDPTARARRLLAGAAIIVALVAAGVVFSRARGNGAHICRGSADKLAGVWEAATRSGPGARREMVRRAFLSSGAAGAAETWERVSVALDRYADRWMGTYVEACEATHVRGEQSAEALDLRMGCLQERLGELKALTDLFSSRGDVTNRAVDAVAGLGALDRCGNVPLLRAVIPPPQDPKKRAALDELQARLARLKALRDSGGDAEGLPAAAALVQDARGLGYKPLIANALLLLASFQDVFGDYRAMELSLYESVEMAEAARLDDTKAFAAAELAAG